MDDHTSRIYRVEFRCDQNLSQRARRRKWLCHHLPRVEGEGDMGCTTSTSACRAPVSIEPILLAADGQLAPCVQMDHVLRHCQRLSLMTTFPVLLFFSLILLPAPPPKSWINIDTLAHGHADDIGIYNITNPTVTAIKSKYKLIDYDLFRNSFGSFVNTRRFTFFSSYSSCVFYGSNPTWRDSFLTGGEITYTRIVGGRGVDSLRDRTDCLHFRSSGYKITLLFT